jgi:S-DNA-T family DNA segregation ATPase FtsK/SpoIIIE
MHSQRRAQSKASAASGRGAGPTGDHRKHAVLAILLLATALLVFLALVSYDPRDEAAADTGIVDLFKLVTGDQVAQARADTAQNWLGLAGAMISNFLITSTVGYSVLLFPFVLMLFGWTLLRRGEFGRVVVLANYTILFAFLLSTCLGMARLLVGEGGLGVEWSGVVGDFLSLLLTRLLGKVGASIVLAVSLFLVLVLAVDLDLHMTLDRLKRMWLRLLDWVSRLREAAIERARARRAERAVSAEERSKAPVSIAKASHEEPGPHAGFEVVQRPRRDEVSPGRTAALQEGAPDEAPPPSKEIRLTVMNKLKEATAAVPPETAHRSGAPVVEEIDYVFPSVDLLNAPRPGKEDVDEEELRANADLLRDTLAEFDVDLESVSVTPGPVVTLYELVPASGVKISRIVSLESDMALKLAAKGIRIMAPIPGKSAVGVEIPNQHRSLVTIRSVINSARFRDSDALLPLAMGKTISGEVFTDDLARMPHLLMAGSTGSGKSIGINTIIASLLYKMHPSELKLVIIDPKKIEMAQYANLRNHFLAISPDVNEEIVTNPRNAVLALKSVELEMEKRYDKLAAAGVRSVTDYNMRCKEGRLKDTETMVHAKLPYILVIIDELADLMITAAREVEEPIARLAQLARAVGIHLIVATQRPSVDVITGVIKANFPARIAYQVASKIDSRTILDMNGAEQLLGNGDMLYLASGSPKPIRLQNGYISPDEVDAVVSHVAKQQGYAVPCMLPSIVERKRGADGSGNSGRDELFEEAARLVVRHQQGSVSLLQRRLKVGYSRAARLVDELEAAGVVGPFDGSKAREVLVESEVDLAGLLHS